MLVENSTWNNIGDGFYQFSLYYMLKSVFADADIAMLEGPIERAFRPRNFKDNAFKLNLIQEADLFVLSGPIMSVSFIEEYGGLIKKIIASGKKYCLLSVHGNGKAQKENLDFLSRYSPVAFSSRDPQTYELYKDCCGKSLNGVCAASLVSKTCPVADICESERYVTVSFYEAFEPPIEAGEDGAIHAPRKRIEKERHWKWMRHLEWMRRYPSDIDGVKIIRPVHDIGYKFSHLNFAKPNSFLSYNPLSYLSLYKQTELTVSNRVHAVLPTLSFGNPAVYYGTTARNGVFERLGIDLRYGCEIRVPQATLDKEFFVMTQFLESSLGEHL
ncbi:polysaccharide pyruvyl transferase family protein [Rhodopirellula islandica]|uniref:polysaccharide pyruvyl transferase family protein n=1 Tax=Rhodopirellula islandica TaxID=595434 RepID=UPI001364C075|nr:polysaccharide pyruvyl transferase family protein [Rhodopirellula islandica]